MKKNSVSRNNQQDNSDPSNTATSLHGIDSEDMLTKTKKCPETSPAVSRYGRTHKPKISDDFLPTDKKVGAILGISPKKLTNPTADGTNSTLSVLARTVEKGRKVSEMLGSNVKKSKRGRKPKLQLTSSDTTEQYLEREKSEPLKTSSDVIKSEASTSEKFENPSKMAEEVIEGSSCNVQEEKENEIMNPDVTSSVDDNSLSKTVWPETPSNESGWNPGDLAWARIGGHPFWPCMIAVDPFTKVFTKIKRVGRGLTAVQRSLHVQFFGDNGRHSWVTTGSVIKFEGRDGLRRFADKVLTEIKKKDKKFSSAFLIRRSSQLQWDLAVKEAEDTLSKTNQERVRMFEELFPPEKYIEECNSRKMDEEAKKNKALKRKRLETEQDEKPVKQIKIEPQDIKVEVNTENMSENQPKSANIPQKKHGKRKKVKRELSDYRLFAEKYSKHASEIHPGITEEKLEKLMLRMWAAMDEHEKSMYSVDTGVSRAESSSDEEENSSGNDSTRESSPVPSSQPLKKNSGLFRGTRQEKVCQICLKPGNTVKCKGLCMSFFHIECSKNPNVGKESENEVETKKKRGRTPKGSKNETLDSSNLSQDKTSKESFDEDSAESNSNSETDKEEPANDKQENKGTRSVDDGEFRCRDCSENRIPCCFVCSKEKDPKTNSEERCRCSNSHCGKYYHLGCVKEWPQASCVDGPTKKNASGIVKLFSAPENSKSQVLTCPQHVCHTCASDDPRNATLRFNHERLVRCILCPTAYHTGNYCVPAGSEILTGCQIICPRHYEPPSKGIHHVNAAWCFICAMVGGSLICCDLCPTSFHADCLKIAPPEEGYICEDCDTGRYPLYGEVVWVKLGAYRWWPAQILFPFEVPDNIDNLPHKRGEFAVKFFGSRDHYWVNRGRVFLYQEGDTGHKSAKRTSVDGLFLKALDEAKEAHSKIKIERSQREAEARPGMKPPSYIRIKCNKPVGIVRVYEADPSSMTPCDCDPKSANPCGADTDCLNRILMVECTPGVCVAGDRCGNQCFSKREYPPLEPFKTESRGWGLRAMRDLRKGEFVIEYVGEMIDETEYRKRLENKHKEKDENYYFLTIDNQRMLDAGPKGNVARFMNHSCHPNCETQKWTVNGDTRVGLFALQDIPMGHELTFNYNLECVGTDKKPCMCGAPNCSGFIGVKVTKPSEDDKRSKMSKQEQQRALKRKKKRQSLKITEGECFECGGGGELLLCDNKTCPKGYHLSCAQRKSWPKGIWLCPWHFCDVCKKRTVKRCGFCPRSFCILHAEGNIRMNNALGLVCVKHDEDTGKSSANGIMEDVELCLKGIGGREIKEEIHEDKIVPTLKTEGDALLSAGELTKLQTSLVSEIKEKISLENPATKMDSVQITNVNGVKSVCKLTHTNDQKGNVLSEISPSPKKRGRPRKYPLTLTSPPPPQPATPKSEPLEQPSTPKSKPLETGLKTPDFHPNSDSVSTLKRKRGRPRKLPLLSSPVDAPMKPSTPKSVEINRGYDDEQNTPVKCANLKSPVKQENKETHTFEVDEASLLSPIKCVEESSMKESKENSQIKITDVPVKSKVISFQKDISKREEDNKNIKTAKESCTVITPRTSSRKRHLSEKLTAFLSKSAKKQGLKSFMNVEINEESKSSIEPSPEVKKEKIKNNVESRKVLKPDKDKSGSHSPKLIKKKQSEAVQVSKSEKGQITKSDKGHRSKSLDSSISKSHLHYSGETGKHKSPLNSALTKSTSSHSTKSDSAKKKISNYERSKLSTSKSTNHNEESKSGKANKVKTISSKSNGAHSVKPTHSTIESKKIEGSYRNEKPYSSSPSSSLIFKCYEKKSTILQRVNHKPELGKITSYFNSKLSHANSPNNSLTSSRNYDLPVTDKIMQQTISPIVDADKNGSVYQKSQINGIDSSRSLLESFDDTESQYSAENITTIPLKFSEFGQMNEEFQTQTSIPEDVDSLQSQKSDFDNLSTEDGTQKLSEDGKYQILTNMRPESLEFDKQNSVLMPVRS